MNEFMLIYKGGDSKWMENTSKEEMAASMERWGAWMAMLEEKKKLVSGGSPLEFEGKRITDGGALVTDISASELKELVTGYSIVLANDMEEAIAIARECPIFNYPDITVEVRQIANIDCS